MSDVSYAAGRTPLELGALVALVTLAIAAVLGTVAVLTADEVASGFGRGLGVAVAIFLIGGTLACALACLARERLTLVSLSSILVAGIAIDLLVLAILVDIETEAYGKVVGVGFVWSFFALVALGLTLAVGETKRLARSLYVGAIGMCVLAGLISTWLVVTSGDGSDPVGLTPEAADTGFYVPAAGLVGDDDLLRALGAALVLIAALWFGALAASRLERGPEPPDAT